MSRAEAQRRGEGETTNKEKQKMNMQFFSKYIDEYKKKNDKIGKIVKVGKSSRGIAYNRKHVDLMPKDKQLRARWNAIKKFFGLEDDDDTFMLFKQAATGLERRRITQLNSSSLFAFLFFHTVSKNNRVKVNINGFEDEFTNVAFEVSNTICENTLMIGEDALIKEYKGRRPDSHIDVVLYNDNTALLLECKFSEYLEHYSPAPAKASRRAYEKFYKMLFVDNGGIDGLMMDTDSKDNKVVTIKGTNGESCYFDGLKQTIAHFMGAQGILDSGSKIKQFDFAGKEIHLAEVVFDFSTYNLPLDEEGKERQNALNDYKKFHNRLCKKLTTVKVTGGRDIIVHPDLLCYQNDFELELPSSFVELYNLPAEKLR